MFTGMIRCVSSDFDVEIAYIAAMPGNGCESDNRVEIESITQWCIS